MKHQPKFKIGQSVMFRGAAVVVKDVQQAAACQGQIYHSKWLYDLAEPNGTNILDIPQRDLREVAR